MLSTRGGCSLRDVWRSRSGPSRPSCQGQKEVFHGALSEVTKVNPPLKLGVFVDDITALLVGKQGSAEMAKKVMKKLKVEVEKRGSNCRSLKMERKERVR